ncbi:tetratricopeptide repeat protein [Lactobacillus sp. LC28-10]|uniref:Tetratricopeptide repeat protein n=1 Tax=Secundilactobacillus angelensis TaxID=2722706 RepID=A0ABX1L0I7_9LACO|nr:tetratricopeptide repeat protein [Secundilactobacillus angelensis]MCH5463117.1 tetratricopeptide repeat protein [Secundilactobacillus angelensis]NLR18970.1 tetratricopeptide repeat protein [Secundilactobacillus angelensis]
MNKSDNPEETAKKKAEREAKQRESEQLMHRLIQEIDDDPDNYHTYYDLGALLVNLKSYTQAEELMVKALGLFADKSRTAKDTLTYGLGNVYYEAGEYQKAIEQFNQVKDTKLKSDAYMMLAQSYMGNNDHKTALAFALTAAENHQQDPQVNQLIADNLLAVGSFKDAAKYYDKTLASDPKNGRAQFDRGIAAVVLEEDASEYFEQAKRLDSKYYENGQKRLADIQAALTQKKDNQSKA